MKGCPGYVVLDGWLHSNIVHWQAVTDPATNQDQCWVTSLINTNALPPNKTNIALASTNHTVAYCGSTTHQKWMNKVPCRYQDDMLVCLRDRIKDGKPSKCSPILETSIACQSWSSSSATVWLGGRVVREPHLWSTGRGFESRPPCGRVHEVTHTCICHQAI